MSAADLNEHLASGGVVQVTTYTRSTLYDKRHTGYFTNDSKGALYVRRGKSKDCLAANGIAFVSIKLGRYHNV